MRKFFGFFSARATSAFLVGCLLSSSPVLADYWGRSPEPIQEMYIYPTYAVIKQVTPNPGLGSVKCQNNAMWSFNWADFDAANQQRIYSTLLAAYLGGKPINVVFVDGCGPEGHKRFRGEIQL